MKVLLEPIRKGWRASSLEPLDLSAEGDTETQALTRLKNKVTERFRSGAKIIELDLDDSLVKHSASEFAGIFKDNPLFDDWQRGIAEYRKEQERIEKELEESGEHAGDN